MNPGVTWNTTELPAFSRPPVSEVIIAAEFIPLVGIDAFQLIEMHDLWSRDFPVRQLHPAIPSAFAGGIEFSLTSGLPPLRLWSQTSRGDVLIQVQADRLILNWRRVQSNEEQAYPSYRSLISRWTGVWDQFCSNLEARGLDSPVPVLVEVSYINSIELNEAEQAFTEFSFFPAMPAVPVVEQATSRLTFVTEGDQCSGRTVVQAEVAVDEPLKVTSSVVTRLAVTADDPFSVLRNALDQAHVASVNTFARSASPAMREKWGIL